MPKDEQARAMLVEIALECAAVGKDGDICPLCDPLTARRRAGFRDPSKGSWGAAGLTAAMEDAELVVPAPGTEARRRSIALLDFVASTGSNVLPRVIGQPWASDAPNDGTFAKQPEPGDIIAWLQHPIPSSMLQSPTAYQEAAGWRRGHVAVIVAVDSESITTVGWNEGPAPGRVMMRRLWRAAERPCAECDGVGNIFRRVDYGTGTYECEGCRGKAVQTAPLSSTVPWRRHGGLYGIARPVAR
jgi:hypothetical protein